MHHYRPARISPFRGIKADGKRYSSQISRWPLTILMADGDVAYACKV
jgi:hypothetical protein